MVLSYELILGATRVSKGGQKCKRSVESSSTLPRPFPAVRQRVRRAFFSFFTANTTEKSPFCDRAKSRLARTAGRAVRLCRPPRGRTSASLRGLTCHSCHRHGWPEKNLYTELVVLRP